MNDGNDRGDATATAAVSRSALQLWRACGDAQSAVRPASVSHRRVLDALAAGARVPLQEATCANLVPLYTSFWSALNDLDAAVPRGIAGLTQPVTPLSVLAAAGRPPPPGQRGVALAAHAVDTLTRLSAGETWPTPLPHRMFLGIAPGDGGGGDDQVDHRGLIPPYTIAVRTPDATGTLVTLDRMGQRIAAMQLDLYGSVIAFDAPGRRRLPRRVRDAPDAAIRALMNSAVGQVADSGASSGIVTLRESQLVWGLLSRSRASRRGGRRRRHGVERTHAGVYDADGNDYASEDEGESEDN
ncbi:hypothetical protein psal_cds_890 [Pandoravirus salinus]|uniref:DUF5848 domain-containing protein n=1 Tax=Pandoravirus salinus TaxID=1349410 RepID=S4VXA1_9VIRU|nr:hypothetical protein psal_cds_890 [Pandoravirus salinus]AGO84978.1 hypothetical protein psal_cds_890 [Pandoravirus salinus]